MIGIEASVQISRPQNEVFEYLTDIERLPRWQTNLAQTRRISGGEIRVGFQFEQSPSMGPWKLRAVCTVTEVRANERFAFAMKSTGPLDCEAHFDLQPIPGGTRLSLAGTARLKGAWRLLQPLLAPVLRRETGAELERLKRLLETVPAANPRQVPSHT